MIAIMGHQGVGNNPPESAVAFHGNLLKVINKTGLGEIALYGR